MPRLRQTWATLCAWAQATSAARSFPRICSGVYRFLLISLPPSIHYSNITYGSVLGGQVTPYTKKREALPS